MTTAEWEAVLGPPTDWAEELQALLERNIVVHAFFVDANAEAAFDIIAGRSAGLSEICSPFFFSAFERKFFLEQPMKMFFSPLKRPDSTAIQIL